MQLETACILFQIWMSSGRWGVLDFGNSVYLEEIEGGMNQ